MIRKTFCLLIFTFCSCQESASTAIPKLSKQLKSKITKERSQAALAAGAYGQDAAPLTEDLIRLLSDKNGGTRSAAAFALRKIDSKDARKALLKAQAVEAKVNSEDVTD